MLATKKQLTVLKSEMSSVLADMNYDIQKNKDSINDLMHGAGFEEKLDLLEEKYYDLDNGIDDINQKLYGIDEDIYELNEMKDNLGYYDLDDITNNKYEIECLQDAVTELEDKNERLEETIDELNNKIDILTKAIEELLEK